MPLKKLRQFLDDNDVKYVTIQHSRAYTADLTAESAHIPGKELAKTVIVKVGPKMTMAVLPASYNIDFSLLKEALSTDHVQLASEEEFEAMFPDCEVGAMPPFGNLYDMDVLVDSTLADDEKISFNAGTHTELMQLSYADFVKLVRPRVLSFAADVFV